MPSRGSSGPWFELGEDSAVWHTFAGGQINATIRYAVESLTGWKCVPDNFTVSIRDPHTRGPTLDELVSTLRSASYWDDDETWGSIAGLLPEYRLSKFQDVLPAAFAEEMTSDVLLDRAGTKAFLCGGEGCRAALSGVLRMRRKHRDRGEAQG